MNKAKVFLKFIGIHKNNTQTYQRSVNLLKSEKLNKYLVLDSLPTQQKIALKEYHKSNSSRGLDDNLEFELSDIYAGEGDEWNDGGIVQLELPFSKFRYAYCSNDFLLVVSETGGSWSSIFFDFYEVSNSKLNKLNSVSHFNDNIFDLALNLKFDDNMKASDMANKKKSE